MKKYMLTLLLLAVPTLSIASTEVECKGTLSFENGTMEGHDTIILKVDDQNNVQLGKYSLGKNVSTDKSIISADSYAWYDNTLTCRRAAKAEYNANTNSLSFKYQYNSGYLGGGCQHTEATFTDCRILD